MPELGHFCVEFSDLPDTPGNEERFMDYQSAMKFAKRKAIDTPCVWLSEIGVNESTGRRWFYFWWTEATEWGECAERGLGYAYYEEDEDVGEDLVEYASIKRSLKRPGRTARKATKSPKSSAKP